MSQRTTKKQPSNSIAEYPRQRPKPDPARRASQDRKYRERHKEQVRQYQREYRAKNPEREAQRGRAYRAGHKDHLLQYQREWHAKNREHVRAYRQEYWRTHGGPPSMLARQVSRLMRKPEEYALRALGIGLRSWQIAPLKPILESIQNHSGDTFVLLFPRQSGKDELLINLTQYLADLYSVLPVSIVHVNPTYRPQTENALRRFDAASQANLLTRGQWRSAGSFTRQLGRLTVRFLSGDKHANVAGATASLLLIINEAQDIQPDVYARKFEPMAASTNATRIIVGTAMTARTLLAQQRRAALHAEKLDGRQRVFTVDADEVARQVPWYGAHVATAVEMHGRQHPMVKTQYFNEELDAQGGMFDVRRRALMLAEPPGPGGQAGGSAYVFCIDVAGQDEAGSESQRALEGLGNPGRDATALSIYTVDLSSLPTLRKPIFSVVQRQQWVGQPHTLVAGQILALVERLRPMHVVVDATGVGETMWTLLAPKLGQRLIPVKFSAQKKSEMGYGMLRLIETGRLHDRCATPEVDEQYAACVHEILPGPLKTMRWGVPDGTRNLNGELIHDDIVMADALITEVDALEWRVSSPTRIVRPKDPLEEMSHFRA